MRIFVIDDEESIRDTFQLFLEELGHEVLTAGSPTQCPVYNGHDCENDDACGHALFIDYLMPEMNALKFIDMMEQRRCKGMTRNKIIMSGNIDSIDVDRANRLGCKILQKPVNFAAIQEIIDAIQPSIDPHEKLSKLAH